MPEFILDHGTAEGTRAFKAVDEFTQGYVECMFFTETGSRDDEELEDATVADLAPEAWDWIKKDCAAFQAAFAAPLALAYATGKYEPVQAGRDFWFTRNGHGVGFRDRDLPDLAADALDTSCGWRTGFPEVDIYRGDDKLVYLTRG